ncbi:hypothetical protein B1R27_28980 [Streptomyces sp. GKU 895]|nr:hypothetical protein B1R27_28980 [Streptomyces sp. GKU 895]
MADEQYEWLNQELAERLLRGESLDNAVEPTARDEAERLAKTLGALSVDPPPSTTELPGEEAALAAFRKAHADRGRARYARSTATARTPTSASSDRRRGTGPRHRRPPPAATARPARARRRCLRHGGGWPRAGAAAADPFGAGEPAPTPRSRPP